MTETPAPYHTTITAAPPAVDPVVLELCELCFYRALSAYEAAERITAHYVSSKYVLVPIIGTLTNKTNIAELLEQRDEMP